MPPHCTSVTPGSTSAVPDHVRTRSAGRISHPASASGSRISAPKARLHSTIEP
ncbi:hypothetical protein [Thermocatellispora tengchongensis]|uniref:hypothetical protein n=1 Tax=Thermocatellispora tengchongensis TaxID=1073253 RepID=UPI0036267E0D